jgi:glycosyltransferase involved in cell wall biosynthesis
MKVFVCDDGSQDGTSEMIKSKFPKVNLVKGSGDLFWNGGMNLAWNSALNDDDFDYFIWLNDDTFLLDNAILDLFNDYEKVGKSSIISAAIKKPDSKEFAFGGQNDSGEVIPNGKVQEVVLINGNFVLVPKNIVAQIGVLSQEFTHYLGDYDYGLRAIALGEKCFTSSKYLGECEVNALPYWGDKNHSFSKRWELLHSVKGLSIKEYTRFLNKHYGSSKAIKNLIFSYSRVIAPSLFISFRNLFSTNKTS